MKTVLLHDQPLSRLGRRGPRPAEQTGAAVALRDVRKVHGRGDGAVVALDGISVGLEPVPSPRSWARRDQGRARSCTSRPGSTGRRRARLRSATSISSKLGERRLTILRRQRVGFVFQAFNLMPTLTVAQNIGLPLRLDGRRPRRADVRAAAERVGLGERLRHYPSQLSGGQQQRVAIARALITQPEVLFADEPTGALDTRNGRAVLALLRELADDGQTVAMVTHDPAAAAYADRVILLADGRIAGSLDHPDADEVAERLAHLGD